METRKSTLTTIKSGYKLGYYKRHNHRIKEALIEIELLDDSKLVDERHHEIYDFLKTDLAKIVKIQGIDGSKVDVAYIVKKPELKYDIKEGEIIRFKFPEFEEILPDYSYIAFYTTKTGAINSGNEVDNNYTGTKIQHQTNGNIKEKHYYVSGSKTHTFGYYNNDFNSLHYSWTFEQSSNKTFPTIREYIYNQQENPVAQYVIIEGKIANKTIYDRTSNVDSIYLQYKKSCNK